VDGLKKTDIFTGGGIERRRHGVLDARGSLSSDGLFGRPVGGHDDNRQTAFIR
jgi:hypothetical protein